MLCQRSHVQVHGPGLPNTPALRPKRHQQGLLRGHHPPQRVWWWLPRKTPETPGPQELQWHCQGRCPQHCRVLLHFAQDLEGVAWPAWLVCPAPLKLLPDERRSSASAHPVWSHHVPSSTAAPHQFCSRSFGPGLNSRGCHCGQVKPIHYWPHWEWLSLHLPTESMAARRR